MNSGDFITTASARTTSARRFRPQPSRRELPFVLMNMAMTADGKIATANREVSTFGSRRDTEHLYALRATADAVLSGARTVEINNVKMGPGGRRFEQLRLSRGLDRYNLRIIASGSGSISPQASIFKHRFSPIIILTSSRASTARRRTLATLADDVLVTGTAEIDFATALRWLRSRWGVNRLLCEGGAELNDALFRAGLVDELNLTICPLVVGGQTAPTLAEGRGVDRLIEGTALRLTSARRAGDELFLTYAARPHRSSTIS